MEVLLLVFLSGICLPTLVSTQGLRYAEKRLTGVDGKTLGTAVSFEQCTTLCDTFPRLCFAIDFHKPTTSCIFFERDDVCTGTLSSVSNWDHYRRETCEESFNKDPSTTVFSCTGSVYFEAGTLGSGEGAEQKLIASQVTLVQCLNSCMQRKTCFGVDYNLAESTCSYSPRYSNSYNRVRLDYTRHYTKLCNISDTAKNIGVTDVPGRTLPPSVDHALADYFANDGPCPAHFQLIPNQIIGQGTVQAGIRDLFACRVTCFLDSSCVAFEWNKVRNQCTILDTIDPSGFSVSLCCDHYRKNTCEHPSCYFQNTVETALFSRTDYNNILLPSQIPDLKLETCPRGLCLTEYTIDTTKVQPVETVRRRCESVEDHPLQECSITRSDPAVFSYKCVCRGNRCNSYSYLHYQALFAYLPLDGSADDFSAFQRSPHPAHDVVNVAFDGVDRKKNSAAYFNGSSYIQINSFGQVTLGEVVDSGPGAGKTRAGLTVAMWLKRTGPLGVQTLLSNGMGGDAPVLISTLPIDVNTHNITVRVGLRASDGQIVYLDANTVGEMNKWQFLVVQVLYDVLSKAVTLSMWITEDQLPATANAVDTKPFPDDQLPLKVTVSPLCLGKQLTHDASQVFFTTDNHYVGFMDEVRVFVQGSVSKNALQAMIDETKPL